VTSCLRRKAEVDMFRRIAAVAACAALFVLLGAVPTGALYVTTLPSSVDVWVDGTYVGHSPLVLDALGAGRHTVSLTKTGWQSQDIDVSVVAGVTSLSSVQMARAPSRTRAGSGFVAIRGIAAREIAIDGQAVKADKSGFFPAGAGLHELSVSTPGGKFNRSITVYPDMRTDVLVREDGAAARSTVVAPASDFLNAEEIKIEGSRVSLHHHGHDVVAMVGSLSYRLDGSRVNFDAAPTLIGGKLYLPIDLLNQLTAADKPK
jgi:hypothetical protein